MFPISRFWLASLLLSLSGVSLLAAVGIDVDPGSARTPISPYIYGTNQDITGVDFTLRRSGGNRMTGYNWENNASNAGSDYLNQSDNFLTSVSGIPDSQAGIPGIVLTKFHDQSLAANVPYSVITLPMAGYVAADKSGPVAAGEAAPSPRWVPVVNTKPTALSATPDLNDGKVYTDELLQFLVSRYGNAASPNGIKGYDLDNEPDLWSNTHSRLHPAKPLCTELINRSVDLAKAVKRIDPAAETLGFVSYGFGGYYDFQGATDWPVEKTKGAYRWFIDYYLDQMKQASTTAGTRLLDVLDLHNYSEAQGGGARVTDSTDYTNIACNKARLQAPRAFWDPNYVENSWIGQYYASYLPFLPGINQSVATFYPGTKIGFSEYNFGGESHISGGIAQADILGIFGKQGVYLASLWPLHSDLTYAAAAFKLYRNYDGAGNKFGDTSVSAATTDAVTSSVFASVESLSATRLHVIVLNKNYDTSTQFDFNVAGGTSFTTARVFAFDATSATITERPPVTGISGNRFSYSLPPLTAAHFILQAGTGAPAHSINHSDFTGDGKADLLWTNAVTGERSMWFLNGSTTIGGAMLNTVPVAWVVSGTGDFNGDGKADVVLTNTMTGDRVIWLMNGSTIVTNAFIGTVPLDWVMSGVGDFNGDGKADIVWTNTVTGDRAMWLMNGSTVLGGGYLGTVPVAWKISGVGDFNGDGKADLVWSNTVTGERSMWFQNGSTTIGGATLNTVPVAWVISGVGDFNGDGKADIFLTNTATGDRVIWLMNGSTIATNAFMGTVPVTWAVSNVGDFDGDGKADLVWTNTVTGDRAMWLVNGATVTGGGFMGTVPVEWKISN